MEVKNFVVTNCEAFINSLVQELINQGISYTQIDNEIHFLDHIFRFYDVTVQENTRQVEGTALMLISEGLEQLQKQSTVFQAPEKMLFTSMSKVNPFIEIKKESSLGDSFPCSGDVFMLDNGKKPYHKQMIKKQNRRANIRLKNNIR